MSDDCNIYHSICFFSFLKDYSNHTSTSVSSKSRCGAKLINNTLPITKIINNDVDLTSRQLLTEIVRKYGPVTSYTGYHKPINGRDSCHLKLRVGGDPFTVLSKDYVVSLTYFNLFWHIPSKMGLSIYERASWLQCHLHEKQKLATITNRRLSELSIYTFHCNYKIGRVSICILISGLVISFFLRYPMEVERGSSTLVLLIFSQNPILIMNSLVATFLFV